MEFDITENPIGIAFGAVAAIVGFFIAGVYTHSLPMMATPMKYFWGIASAVVCGIGGYLVAYQS